MSCKMGNFMNLRVFALLGVLLLAGCSGLSVRHLPSNPWKNEASQNIQMRYLAFQYQVIPVGNELGIVAEAYPVIDKLPDWASWYGEIDRPPCGTGRFRGSRGTAWRVRVHAA